MATEWINPLFGGVLISFSLYAFFIVNNGRFSIGEMLITALERNPSSSWNNQLLFLIGIIVSPISFTTLFYPINSKMLQNEPLLVVLAGLLVGIGYKLCNGGLITRTVLVSFTGIKTSLILALLFLIFGKIGQFLIYTAGT